MIALGSDELNVSGCSVSASLTERVVELRITGNPSWDAAQDLERTFARVHDECARLRVQLVRIDLRELEFMNSACFKPFVSWLLRIEALPEAERYRIVLVQDPARHWQKRSFQALQAMAEGAISIEPEDSVES